MPVQIIHPAGPFCLPLVDLRGLTEVERQLRARELVRQEVHRPYDLERGPLLRAYLLRLDALQHVLLLTFHHIVFDGWSQDVFVRELTALYQAFSAGRPSPLAPLPIQYADFALWQRQWLRNEVLESQLLYWRQHLANLAPLELPTNHPRPSRPTYRGDVWSLQLPNNLQERLLALSQREGVTLFMLLLAAYQVLLVRYSGQTDISVGTPIANRTLPELEGLIGFFVNTLVMRTDLSGNPSFVEILRRVRETALGAYAHQDIPFEQLVEELQPERNLDRSPLFQVMFLLQQQQQIAEPVEQVKDVKIAAVGAERNTTKFDLTLSVVSDLRGMYCSVEYNADLFESETIQRLLEHWQILLEGIVADPFASLSDLPLLAHEERHRLLVEWNPIRADYSLHIALHQWFEQQVDRSPDAIALVYQEHYLSYRALNCQANALARDLRARGIASETRVGICVERSLEMVVGLLGILKAGAAYVPIDPQYPQERFAFILQDAQISLLLTQRSLLERLPDCQAPMIVLDDFVSHDAEDVENISLAVEPHHLAYVIYTSGSTGRPKGVMIEHRNAVTFLCWARENFSQVDLAATLAATSICFDLSIFELFVPLSCGGSVILAENALQLLTLRNTHAITLINTVPSVLTELLRFGPLPSSICTVNLAGEALPARLVQQLYQEEHIQRVLNLYGPTEDTTYSTFIQLRKDEHTSTIPIGQPVSNTQVYVLDQYLQPVPISVPGEIYLSGDGQARGYLNRPELTAERFVPHPFIDQPGARLYRTGDLGRYRTDGVLEYLGRIDQQVKVRGYRIELGEIESALAKYPGVRECVVVAREDQDRSGELYLAAYIVGSDQALQINETAIRSHLQETLPAYMLPAFFVALESLPQTPNGKIDRAALPTPDRFTWALSEEQIGPRNALEELLAELWCDVLGCAMVGIHENFFALGGHSLLATQLISRVRAVLQAEIPLRCIFEAPTVAGLAQLLESALQTEQSGNIPPLLPVVRTQALPLSFAQQRLWFLDRLEPGNIVYLIPSVRHIYGALHLFALERSFAELIQRHEILRTTFQEQQGQVTQVISPAAVFRLPIIDLRALPEGECECETRKLAGQEAQQPCDLSRGPLLRTTLLWQDQEEYVLLLTMHHSITDGWSDTIFYRELMALYQAFSNGRPSPLSPLPIQYADFALWQRQWLQGEVLEAQLAYWKRHLTGVAPLDLPTDYPRPPRQTFRGSSLSLQLPSSLRDALIALSKQEGVTLFMLLLGAFSSLLARYSGQSDISVGTAIANRTRSELEGVIGFFANTLVMRTDLSGDPSFRELLGRVREVALGAYTHQDVPFEQLVEVLQPERDLSRSPLFQVMFVLQQQQQQAVESVTPIEGLRIRGMGTEHTTTRFDLTLTVVNGPGMHCNIEYNTDLFAEETMRGLLERWQRLLHGIARAPQTRISALPLLSASEIQQQLLDWNATDAPLPQGAEASLARRFEQQVRQTPERVALVFEDSLVTYAHLNRRANQLAHLLRSLGVGPEVVVGIALPRGLWLHIALLAVLKAGGAYLPLDLSYPAERLRFMLQNSQASILLTGSLQDPEVAALTESLPPLECQVLSLPAIWSQLASAPLDNLPGEPLPDSLAYVIYTSGSTGQPKGAMNTQRGIANRLTWMQRVYGLNAQDRVLQKTPISFDVSVWELFWPLVEGAQLVLARPEGQRDPAYLIELIEQQQVTLLHFVPSLLQVFLQEEGVERCQSLRQVICSGEVLSGGLYTSFVQRLRQCRLDNLYGPTEAAVDVSRWSCAVEEVESVGSVPIGRPIENLRLYVLDGQGRLVPPGVPGELYIGGIGVGRGYVGRGDLTAERFVPNPFVEQEQLRGEGAGAWLRLYRTGDRVRYDRRGVLEYVGRMDEQVKLRGQRIELREIEQVMQGYEQVKDSVVVLREDGGGGKHLVGYVVTGEREPLEEGELRQYLQERLPGYMVPTWLLQVEAWPLLPNGKLDRRGLPEPQRATGADREVVAPRTPLEEILAGLWCGALGQTSIGIHDNFFHLGGHSLLAALLVSRIKAAFHVEVPLRLLFEQPTVAGFAQWLEQALYEGRNIDTAPLVSLPRTGDVPLSFAQQRLWFLDQLEPGNTAYLISKAHRLHGTLNYVALVRSFSVMIQRHEILRTTFHMPGDQPVQVIHPAAVFHLPLIDLSGLDNVEREAETRRLAVQETRTPCNLSQGPLLRATLLRSLHDEHILLFTMHHIISDGLSQEIFVHELTALYQAFADGLLSPLSPLPIQYADFAIWQRFWLQGEVLEAQLAYWKRHLASITPLELPTDHARPPVQTYQGASQYAVVPAELYKELVAFSQQENVTLFMLLLAAFSVLLGRYSGQTDIAIGTPIANRSRVELEGVIGLFLNTLVMRTDLSGNPSFRSLLRQVREVALDAYAHQDVPFEQLVEELQPERDLSRSPLFQVVFNMQQASISTERPQGLHLSGLNIAEQSTTKFDLTLSVSTSAQGLQCGVEYNVNLFEPETIQRFLEHWQILLQSIVSVPDEHLAYLPLLSTVERRRLLTEWNDTRSTFPAERCIHELVHDQAVHTPDSVALVFGDTSLTYAALEMYAQRVAQHLRLQGVKPGTRVGLAMERSLELVVGMLGILHAGGAYVPLDPTYPRERLSFMLEDSRAAVLVTQPWLVDGLPAHTSSLLCLPDALFAASATREQDTPCDARQTAYVIYTSGSTGRPKGTIISHRAVVNFFTSMVREPGIGKQDVVLAVTSFSFDIAALELLLPLTIGACISIVDRQVAADGLALANALEVSAATIFQATPSTWRMLLLSEWSGHPQLKMLCGGEALPVDLADQLLSKGGQLWNMYGPTETTIWSSIYRIQQHEERLSIGSAIDNTQLYVLSDASSPVPIGVAGELYIGGVGLADGYLGRPELTAERFLPDPFSEESGARMYRTGDSVRWLASGRIEYLGRIDQQIKLRGYRIEVGEIETLLLQHSAVHMGVVALRTDGSGELSLVAYVVGVGEAEITAGLLRSYLQGKLPEYMIPSYIVILEALPLTPNGKVDRRALPDPQTFERETSTSGSPQTPIEELLTTIWCDVLGRSAIERDANFFALGGHSLLATRLISRIRSMLQLEIPLQSLFESPTIAGLAQHVEAALHIGQGLQSLPLVPVSRSADLPLSFAQQRLWFVDQLMPDNIAYLMPGGRRLIGALQVNALERSFTAMIERHETLRTTFQEKNGQPVQVISPPHAFYLPLVDLSGLHRDARETAMQQLARDEARRLCDLAVGPLMRATLLRLETEEHILLLTMHHIIMDAWSNDVFMRDLTTFYQGFVDGTSPSLPPLPVQYADFAVWQRQWLQGEVLDAQLAYWKQQLADIPSLELPTDRPRPPVQTYRGGSEVLLLPASLGSELNVLSRQEGVTLFMLLLGAFAVLLARYSGQTDISTGSPIANRTRSELEGLLGFFANSLVMRIDVSGNPTFLEVVKRVRNVALNAYTHQDVPFEQLVEALQPERDLSRPPLFQVMFGVQQLSEGTETPQTPPSALRVAGLSREHSTTRFDITFNVVSSAQGLRCDVEYSTDLFDASTIQQMLTSWHCLLEGIVADPQTSVLDLPLLTAVQSQQLLAEWSGQSHDPVEIASLPTLFEAQVQRTPDAIALVSDQGCLSYAHLERRANQLAHLLRQRGVGPEVLVAVIGTRSVELLISLLAISKAGGGYVPLDPASPSERLAYQLTDAGVSLLLSVHPWSWQTSTVSVESLALSQLWSQLETAASEPPSLPRDAENVAYVIYTSGSTGQPKGVAVSHWGLGNLVRGQVTAFGIGPQSRVLQFASPSFDASIAEMLVSLLAGASLHLAEPEQLQPGQPLLRLLEERAITVVTLPPSVLRVLPEGGMPGVETLVVAGEACGEDEVEGWSEGRRMCNAYGPTETTVCASIAEGLQAEGRAPSIGRALSPTQLFVLDGQQRLVPPGVPGELYIGGPGLARGYIGKAELTAERFVPHVWSEQPGERLYRTGDRVKYGEDGRLHYLGRIDRQVKLRGYRIELGEIEAVLKRHPLVQDAVVLLEEDALGGQRLSAYYAIGNVSNSASLEDDIRAWLQEKLPEYMLPSRFIALDALPLTQNGKIDRKALSSMEQLRSTDPDMEIALPRTPLEKLLTEIWCEVLDDDQIGIYDNFFKLGGHSLLATQLLSRVQAMLHIEVPVMSLFQAPTIAELATVIQQKQVELMEQTGSEEISAILNALETMSDDEFNSLFSSDM
ncbi:non-ribosomal peptide synthetase [Ktedonobacteria bacterium brp13]|nr:non-ribosomal peptide synthetase [Ktedonobacteria bacterium brp13]